MFWWKNCTVNIYWSIEYISSLCWPWRTESMFIISVTSILSLQWQKFILHCGMVIISYKHKFPLSLQDEKVVCKLQFNAHCPVWPCLEILWTEFSRIIYLNIFLMLTLVDKIVYIVFWARHSAFNPALGRQRQVDLLTFEDSIISRAARALQRISVSKN